MVAEGLEMAHDGGADQSSVAGDVDSGCGVHVKRIDEIWIVAVRVGGGTLLRLLTLDGVRTLARNVPSVAAWRRVVGDELRPPTRWR